MVFGFLFWVFLIGIIVASLQDLKRKEVDNWLNLFLLLVSFSFIFFRAIFERDGSIIFHAGFVLVMMFVVMNMFYYGRVFAGGDAKLLFAMAVFFVGATFYVTMVNLGIFILFLMFSGSVYGLVYSFVLYVKDFGKVNKKMRKMVDGRWWIVGGGVVVMFLGFFNWVFLLIGVFWVLILLLYVFAKGIESVSMIRTISGKNLREGDWLVEDVRVEGKVIKADWDGLSLNDIALLRGRKRVRVKEGLPFVPAFLIAFLGYVFLREWIISFLIGLV
jgi:Flp pilus assembly protein protease CpaA